MARAEKSENISPTHPRRVALRSGPPLFGLGAGDRGAIRGFLSSFLSFSGEIRTEISRKFDIPEKFDHRMRFPGNSKFPGSLRLGISPFATIGAFFLLFCASQEKVELKFPEFDIPEIRFPGKIPNFSFVLRILDPGSNSIPTGGHERVQLGFGREPGHQEW